MLLTLYGGLRIVMVQVGPLLFSIGQGSQLIIVKKFIIFSKS